MAPGGEVSMAAAGESVCGGEAEQGREKVCQELIEFVLPALTLGPMAYQATSPEVLKTDLPLLGHLISPSPCLQMSTPYHQRFSRHLPSLIRLQGCDALWDEVSKSFRTFLTSGGP